MSVRVQTEPADRGAAMEALFAAGAGGVQEDGDALVTHFPPGTDSAELRQLLACATPSAVVDIGVTPTVDWT